MWNMDPKVSFSPEARFLHFAPRDMVQSETRNTGRPTVMSTPPPQLSRTWYLWDSHENVCKVSLEVMAFQNSHVVVSGLVCQTGFGIILFLEIIWDQS